MLYESTKSLLLSILRSLETSDEIRWDDQIESGNACLYEMHQMCVPRYRAYRSDNFNAALAAQSTLPEKLSRAMPHVRTMVIAIRHKDRNLALESGRTALAEMNGANSPVPSASSTAPKVETTPTPAIRQREKSATKRVAVMVDRKAPKQVRASGGK